MTEPLDTVDGNTVLAAAQACGLEPQDVTTSYSGRYMYGAECLAVYLPSGTNLHRQFMVELTAALVRDALAAASHDSVDSDVELALDTAVRMAKAARTDQMGHDMVLYFPDWNLHGDWFGAPEGGE